MINFTARRFLYLTFLVLAAGNVFIWQAIIFGGGAQNLELYFLDVGQGDSQLINFSDEVQILIDGGRGPIVLEELSKVLASTDRYIDLVIATHADFDHYGGLIDVLKNYRVGAVITNGRPGSAGAYQDFEKVIRENGVQKINLTAGDKIKYQDAVLEVLSPLYSRLNTGVKELKNKNENDLSLVFLLSKGPLRALYTGDIEAKKEKELAAKYDLSAQILKVSHHGSRYSSAPEFLAKIAPKISVIGVGKENKYGHPTEEVLGRLANIGSQVFRTDKDGTVKIVFDKERLSVFRK